MKAEARRAFGQALDVALAARGVTQTELGNRVGVVQSAVSAWKSGDAAPDAELAFRVEEALDMPPGSLTKHLGFVPVGAGQPTSFEDAVLADPLLDMREKRALLAFYREVTHDEPANGNNHAPV